MQLILQKTARALGVAALIVTGLIYVGKNTSSMMNLRSVYADETNPVECFIKTIGNCPVIAGQPTGRRVSCDLVAEYTRSVSCTPVSCALGEQSPVVCGPPPAQTGKGSGTQTSGTCTSNCGSWTERRKDCDENNPRFN